MRPAVVFGGGGERGGHQLQCTAPALTFRRMLCCLTRKSYIIFYSNAIVYMGHTVCLFIATDSALIRKWSFGALRYFKGEPGKLVNESAGLVIERLRVRIPAGAAGEFSSPELTFLFGVSSTPLLPQWHVKDPGHSAKRASGRLHLNTRKHP